MQIFILDDRDICAKKRKNYGEGNELGHALRPFYAFSGHELRLLPQNIWRADQDSTKDGSLKKKKDEQ